MHHPTLSGLSGFGALLSRLFDRSSPGDQAKNESAEAALENRLIVSEIVGYLA